MLLNISPVSQYRKFTKSCQKRYDRGLAPPVQCEISLLACLAHNSSVPGSNPGLVTFGPMHESLYIQIHAYLESRCNKSNYKNIYLQF